MLKLGGASLLRAGSANNAVVEDGGVAGFCDLTSDYRSNRQAVVTQVAVSIPTDAMADIPGSNLPRDINLSEGTHQGQKFWAKGATVCALSASSSWTE